MQKNFLLLVFLSLLISSSCFAAPATMYVTVAGAGDNSGDSWANAMAFSDWETDVEGSAEAGDTYYMAAGTYTLTSTIDPAASGSGALPISFIGVASGTSNEPPVLADYPVGDARPLIAGGSNTFNPNADQMLIVKNIRFTFAAAYQGLNLKYGYAENVKATGSTTGEGIINLREESICNQCEASDTHNDGYGVHVQGLLINSYIHDCAFGCVNIINNNMRVHGVVNSIIETCGTNGINTDGDNYDTPVVIGNTFYNNTTHVNAGTAPTSGEGGFIILANNIFDNGTTGVTATAAAGGYISNYNLYSNNTTDLNNITAGWQDVVSDITLNAPGDGDFTLPDSSVAEGVAAQVGTNTGAVGDYNWNIGADQTDTQSGGAYRRRIILTENPRLWEINEIIDNIMLER